MSKRYRITTPSPKYTGDSAGVHFKGGVAEVVITSDDPQDETRRQVAYFREAGYGVVELDADGEPVETASNAGPTEPLPGDDAPEWIWRMYAVQHAGMNVPEVNALGDRADVMKAVRDRIGQPAAEPKPAARKRGSRKAAAALGDDATDDELRHHVRTKAVEAGDDDLAHKVDTMSRDELLAFVKGQAK